ncbi:LysM peptidoglycan-binding domain-containing protein [uncultured Planktomarina sp.]|jgi:nucleoid-associated protein YgaU|uniref:LysM peptidoglycan-binding domain-containing protein n=1 Tax=uncultured Planktomarina sp. TaxID=1538529 RepID=UPI0032619BFF
MSVTDKKKVTEPSRNTAAIIAGVIGLVLLWWFYPQIRAAVDPQNEGPTVEEAAAPASNDAGSEAEAEPEAGAETGAESDIKAESDNPSAQDAGSAPDPAVAEAAPEETAKESQSAEAGTDTPAEPLSNSLSAPKFDVVRIEDDGSALIAGQAQGRGHVVLSVDGVELPEARADLTGNGQFVIFAFLPATADQQSLKLHLYAQDGSGPVVSVQTIFVAPAPVEEAVAASESVAPESEAPAETETTDETNDATETDIEVETAPTQTASTEAPEDAAPATVILADEDGVRVLQDGTPSAANPAVTIDTISYSSNGDVILGGRGQAGNFVRIYLDNQSIATSKISANGYWSLELSDIEPGIYTLRVDELNATGDVVSRAETPFKREAAEELAELMAPETEPEEPSVEVPSQNVAEAQSAQADAPSSDAPETAAETVADTGSDTAPDTSVTQVEVTVQAEVAELNPQDEQSSDGETVATEAQPADTASVLRTPSQTFRVRTVQPGSTLWAIAKESYGAGIEYFKVFEANKERIRDPDLIYPGQVFEIPD